MQIQIESSATATASSLLAYCDHSATVLDLYTGLKWIYSGDAWVVYTGIGPQGPQGAVGAQGVAGANGVDGVQGPQGSAGSQGPAGVQGAGGPQGLTGAQGAPGAQGSAGADGGNYKTTSASNVTMGTGTKSFTVAAGLSYTLDQRVVMAYSSTKYMYGRVTGYSGTTLTVYADFTSDTSVSYSSWTINLMGERGMVLNATSTTSKTIATGAQTITIQTLCSFVAGQRIIVSYDTSNYMVGLITTYIPTTGSLTFTVNEIVGSGTYNSWTVSITGSKGNQGAQGAQGTAGTNGTQGAQGAQGASVQGPQGVQGTMGYQGHQGVQGSQGHQGVQGYAMNVTVSTSTPSGTGNNGDVWIVVPA